MGRASTARILDARREARPMMVPPPRLLPPAPLRPRVPGVIPHPDEYMADNEKVLAELLDVFAASHVAYALVGGLVAGLYGKGRTTEDVDLLIPRRAMDRLAQDIAARGYEVQRSEDMLRACRGGVAVADLVVREAHPVLRAASAKTEPALILGLVVDVVPRGAFVALKFHAAISPTRRPQDKYVDVADIAQVVARGLSVEDERLALTIAAKIYPGARAELRRLLDDMRHGRAVRI